MHHSPQGFTGNDESPKEPRLSWAEKARRQLSASHRNGNRAGSGKRGGLHFTNNTWEQENAVETEQNQHVGFLVPLQNLPIDAWDIISSYMNFRDVQLLSSTCRFFWVGLHGRENIWRDQLEHFRYDMANLRGSGQMLCTEFLTSGPCTAYERIKLEHKLYAKDARREWHFRDQEQTDDLSGIFSCPLIFNTDDVELENQNPLSLDEEEVLAMSRIRVLRPVPRSAVESANNSTNGGGYRCNNGTIYPTSSIYTPSEYLTICDNINHGDFTWSRTVVQDCTADEDELMLFALQQTLRRARRPPTRNSLRDGANTSCRLLLRHFSGILLSISRYEAEQILNWTLHMRSIIDDFDIFSDSARTALGDTVRLVPLLQTRYFIAPELCEGGRVGLIVVDPVRVLVVVGKEAVSRDDPLWDEAYTNALVEGRTPQGSGRNPQALRRG